MARPKKIVPAPQPSPLALWFKLNEAENLATLKAKARANGHTQPQVAAALQEYGSL